MEPSIVAWWKSARPFFEEHAVVIVPQIDDEIRRLEKLAATDPTFFVCVLGQSAVGKSTLLNAIVAGEQTILPAGGVGPLTALATEVKFSTEPYFKVTYRDRKTLNGFRLRLEKELRRQERDTARLLPAADPGDDAALAELALEDAPETEGTEDGAGASPAPSSGISELLKQVTQLITDDQFREIEFDALVTGFRRILGLKTDESIQFPEDDSKRIRMAAEIVMQTKVGTTVRFDSTRSRTEFDRALHEHVSGFLAPLVEKIEVGYPSQALEDEIVLVDLPGIGIANDRYRTVTSDYVRGQASAVILVVDRAGPTQTTVDLIRESGYWDRLVLSSADPESDPCALVLVVTKIDDVAKERYSQSAYLPKSERPRTADIFATLRGEVRDAMRRQAESTFAQLGNAATADADVAAARTAAQATLMQSLEVFPLSATQYRAYLAADDENPAFIRDSAASGIPDFVAHLHVLARNHRQRQADAQNIVAARLARNILTVLDQVEGVWTASSRAAEEAVKLRDELERFLGPKRLELANRTGAYREFLETAGTTRIGDLVAKAQAAAQAEVTTYLRDLRAVHWGTLRATVVRGGAFVSGRGAKVDLAADVALGFQEPMAGIWGRTLLKEIRTRTVQYGTSLEKAIDDICVWADSRSDTTVQQQVLRVQKQLMADRVRQIGQIGNEAIDDLKDAIKRELMASIEGPIRRQCEDFRKRGDAYGPGVKQRILALFEQLASEAVASAAGPATALLQARFFEVRSDIMKALDDWGDPIEQAADAIVEREEQRVLRSDAQRKTRVLADVHAFRRSFLSLGACASDELANR